MRASRAPALSGRMAIHSCLPIVRVEEVKWRWELGRVVILLVVERVSNRDNGIGTAVLIESCCCVWMFVVMKWGSKAEVRLKDQAVRVDGMVWSAVGHSEPHQAIGQ